MTVASIEDILMLLSESLTDKSEESKARFRSFIAQPKWTVEDYEGWFEECSEKGGRDSEGHAYYNAVQDIVVSLGERLGMEIEYGRYSGSQHETGFDGLWKRESGEVIVLEVKTSPWPVDKVRQLGDYLEELTTQKGWDLQNVYGLYAIGPGDYEALITQIRGSEWRNQMRLISFENLLRLTELADQLDAIGGPGTGAAKAQRVLLPVETIDVGNLIDLITEIAEFRRQEAVEEGEEKTKEKGSAAALWERQVLLEYLRNTTSFQKTLLGTLVSVEDDWISRKQLLNLMSKVATVLPDAKDHEMTGATIAGARAGLKMRRGDKEDIIEQRKKRYRLREEYREIVADWAKSEGLLEPLGEEIV